MTRIETTRDVLYQLGRASGLKSVEGPSGTKQAQDVETLGRKIAEAASLGPVEVVAVD